MNTETNHPEARHRGPIGYVLGFCALLTCPCHLPALVLLLSGTAAGALLSEHLLAGAGLLLLLCIAFLATAVWALQDHSLEYRIQLKESAPSQVSRQDGPRD